VTSSAANNWEIEFYTSWSDASIKFKRPFKSLATTLKAEGIKCGAVDCGLWGDLCKQEGLNSTATGFPVLKCYSGGTSVVYDGILNGTSEVRDFCSEFFALGPHAEMFEKFLNKLSEKGFFGVSIQGSQKYEQLLDDAKKKFLSSVS